MNHFPDAFTHNPTTVIFGCGIAASLVYGLALAIQRLFFHPLSKFPGPRLAAVSTLYRTYYELVKGGEFLRTIGHLHSIHGPVVRIGPNELHFDDYHAYPEIYSVGSRFTKDPTFYGCFNASDSAFGAINPEESRARRGIMHAFFSRRAILQLEDIIYQKVQILVCKIARRGDKPTNMFLAFRSVTLDIITEYMFGHCADTLNYVDFNAPLLLDIQAALPLLWLMKSFPLTAFVISILPKWLTGGIHDQFQAFCGIRGFIIAWLDRTAIEAAAFPGVENFTICHSLLDPSTKTSHSVSSTPPVFDEALSLLQAGSDTVGNTCTVGAFYILNDQRVLSRLTEELQSVWPDDEDRVDVAILQSLPYLTAVIKEALRLSHGFVTPLPRVVGPLGAKIAGYKIPSDTIVGMSVTTVHLNSTLFPNPSAFIPERWIGPSSGSLDRHLVSFSKGPRMCLGIGMAWVELYIIFSHIFRKLNLEIVNTSIEDFRHFKDYFVPVHQGRQLHVRGVTVAS